MSGGEWTRVAASGDVPVGSVRSVDDHDVVVWKAEDGTVSVMDARCPHQWSHLGALGVVDGCELVCASHFWRFDRSGVGSKLNATGRRDPKSDISTFDSIERDGEIWARLGEGGS